MNPDWTATPTNTIIRMPFCFSPSHDFKIIYIPLPMTLRQPTKFADMPFNQMSMSLLGYLFCLTLAGGVIEQVATLYPIPTLGSSS